MNKRLLWLDFSRSIPASRSGSQVAHKRHTNAFLIKGMPLSNVQTFRTTFEYCGKPLPVVAVSRRCSLLGGGEAGRVWDLGQWMTLNLPEIDVWRAAQLLIERHGSIANIAAAIVADELLIVGDKAVWLAIKRAIEELQRSRPENGDLPN
jgi:hypothetical protein